MKVTCDIDEGEVLSDDGDWNWGITATCSRCGYETVSFGTDVPSVRRCLVLMREGCPRRESNYYTERDITYGTLTLPVSFRDIAAASYNEGRVAQVSAQLGWRVFPVVPGKKKPALDGWPELATTDLNKIRYWWGDEFPGYRVGVATGAESGIWVLDLDVKRDEYNHIIANGLATFRDLIVANGGTDWPDTLMVKTPSGGRHFYFRWPDDGRVVRNVGSTSRNPGPVGHGVDVRGRNGQVLAPLTQAPGGSYEVVNPHVPAEAPAWLLDLVVRKPPKRRPRGDLSPLSGAPAEAVRAAAGRLASVTEGRNTALNGEAFILGIYGGAVDEHHAWAALRGACAVNGLLADDGEDQCRATFESGWVAGLTTEEDQ